jgi:hypothetical protein
MKSLLFGWHYSIIVIKYLVVSIKILLMFSWAGRFNPYTYLHNKNAKIGYILFLELRPQFWFQKFKISEVLSFGRSVLVNSPWACLILVTLIVNQVMLVCQFTFSIELCV